MRQCSQAQIPKPRKKGRYPLYGLWALCVLLAFLLLAGCTEEAVPPGEKPEAPGVLIEYSRTGGIAGVMDYAVVFSDGWVVYNSIHHGTGGFYLGARDMELLRGLIRDADIPGLLDSYPAPVPGADYYAYRIIVGNRTISTETTGIPAPLVPVITTMDELISRHGPPP
ncbi:MAG: hypothetical protein A4E37_00972 [Methanoregulaceae archaeon PtaB.Bin056]|nr:MAG: hypothetical protein A4E37_00972 [Methanoregulaceae archaeon PtaB.Bin056]